uniref:(northern house mosquito) hypothetical protein n=1 Tax=Culex pipiens TaxID=7175 RepID=A0A8D8A914_CULPI
MRREDIRAGRDGERAERSDRPGAGVHPGSAHVQQLAAAGTNGRYQATVQRHQLHPAGAHRVLRVDQRRSPDETERADDAREGTHAKHCRAEPGVQRNARKRRQPVGSDGERVQRQDLQVRNGRNEPQVQNLPTRRATQQRQRVRPRADITLGRGGEQPQKPSLQTQQRKQRAHCQTCRPPRRVLHPQGRVPQTPELPSRPSRRKPRKGKAQNPHPGGGTLPLNAPTQGCRRLPPVRTRPSPRPAYVRLQGAQPHRSDQQRAARGGRNARGSHPGAANAAQRRRRTHQASGGGAAGEAGPDSAHAAQRKHQSRRWRRLRTQLGAGAGRAHQRQLLEAGLRDSSTESAVPRGQ